MAMLGGEGNSEGLRDYLYQRFDPVYSGYGATDVEIGIAGETPLSLAIRRRARTDLAFRKALFGADSRLPMVFQYNPLMHYIEVNERNELIFTISRLNVVAPRIRHNIHDEGGVASYAQVRERGLHAGVDLDELVSGPGTRPFRLPFLWIYGRADSTVSVMGANIYPEDVEECLYEERDLARITQSYCLGLEEGVDAAVRPGFSFEVTAEITPELEREFAERITSRLIELNADFRETMHEQSASAAPVVHLFPPGGGPFAADARRIKQVRMLPRPTG